MEYFAHFRPEQGAGQSIRAHLTQTAALAETFAKAFGAEAEASFCGNIHDIGKYSDAFQARLRGASTEVDHSTAGTLEALRLNDIAAAFCIAGHHAGLPDYGNRMNTAQDATLMARVRRRPGHEIADYAAFRSEIAVPAAVPRDSRLNTPESMFMYTHMVFSCLVDADWLDTERFMRPDAPARGTGDDIPTLCARLDRYTAAWQHPGTPLNERRTQILRQLTDAAARPPGLYTLSVPTGGGKTVSSMAFALHHARRHGLRRVIYMIPYTSIIEQTQQVFERIFGPENVVAHYADMDVANDETGAPSARYLAAENWDAPIILTTAVQFFESVFHNRPSRCRKLHNIAQSVLIFDEAQTLPVHLLCPCVWAITELVKNYGSTAVLCTATQPALDPIVAQFLPASAVELCPDARRNYDFFRRVTVQNDGALSDEALAARLADEPQVLCIVNNRLQAQQLFQKLPADDAYHLSTAMTAVHRRQVLDEIRARLRAGQPCRVVSTSLIEAGVDVDFPCVYRAVAGLDSMIQAAGRCNREGKRPAEASVVHLFDSESPPPRGLEQNIAAARRVMAEYDDITAPEAIRAYFDFLLYTLKAPNALDTPQIMAQIHDRMAFASVAKAFHLIDDSSVTVYVPMGAGGELIRELELFGPNRALLRKLGPYSVSVYPYTYQKLAEVGAVHGVGENAAVLDDAACYHEKTGLDLAPTGGREYFR